jgi:SAM-dependent methyltransferase
MDAIYDQIGTRYRTTRSADPRIAARIRHALGDARTVLDVGAGTGSYEPTDRLVVPLEPSAVMRAQRLPGGVPAVAATAEAIPFDDDTFDAVMAVLTIHHWSDVEAGLREAARVARQRVVILTLDIERFGEGWLPSRYVPEVVARDRERFPTFEEIARWLGSSCVVDPVPVPADCADGFFEAFWARPEMYLDPDVRASQSGWHSVGPQVEARAVAQLRSDLEDGTWDRLFGDLRTRTEHDNGYRLVVADVSGAEYRAVHADAYRVG